jgi:hypothetical protein
MLAFLSAVDGFYVALHTIDSRNSSDKNARGAFFVALVAECAQVPLRL